MGEEGRSAHRTFRRLAESLAEQGIVALRFDYDGTGDSAGLQDDPDRVASWLGSVEAARQFLLDLGTPDVSAVGMRLGATLAGCQAAASTPFHSLVLWDPCLSGRTFLREGEALFALGEGDGRVDDDGFRHTPGFQYDAATASAMGSIDLAKLPADRPLADRVLLLSRTDRPAPRSIEQRVRLEPGEVELQPATAQDQLLDRTPSDCYVPEEALAGIITWLVAGADEIRVPVKAAEERSVRVSAGGPGSAPVLERSVRFGPLGVYGLVDQPVSADPRTLGGAGQRGRRAPHRTGPSLGRVGPQLGRRRLPGRPDRPERHRRQSLPPRPARGRDVRSRVDRRTCGRSSRALSADGSTVVVMGLCSGSYSAFEVALWEKVEAVFAVNPRITLFQAAKGNHVYTSIRRAGIVPARPVAKLAERHRILAGGIWRIYRQLAVWHAPFRVLRGVVKRGTAVHVSTCHDDGQHFTEVLFWRPFLAVLRRNPRFRFEEDEVFDHSLLSRRGQLVTYERASEFLATYAAVPAEDRKVAAS